MKKPSFYHDKKKNRALNPERQDQKKKKVAQNEMVM